ncbi:hypothetical protein B8W72_29910 [Pseudomonas putida]|uniref:PIN domain-containing protein n=1 Tax=Pseudomonas putida TaxID=303 RepID=A0A1Y3KA10_PSEPU|nr:hypothetical protein [Pseudomonas putida]OUM22666.1 hypothetical protein B8W72_29910 [Pseudomonas putida]
MIQGGIADTINQSHSGGGDNVGLKLDMVVQALAPADLRDAIAAVQASVRRKDVAIARTQLEMLKLTKSGNSEVSDLLDVIALAGELVEPEGTQAALNAVTRVCAVTRDDTVRDHCIAALLKFSRSTDFEASAQALYHDTPQTGPYSREAFYRYYATEDVLLTASKQLILSEAELAGIVDGAHRLDALEISEPAAARLSQLYPSQNSRVLLLISTALRLTPVFRTRQYWLTDPQSKQSIDDLVSELADLIDVSGGNDARLFNMAGAILEYFQTSLPTRLVEACAHHLDQLSALYPEIAARIRAARGDSSELSPAMRSVTEAQHSNEARSSWCRSLLDSEAVDALDAVFFTRLANTAELERWIVLEKPLRDSGDIEEQRRFHDLLPDEILEAYSHESMVAMRYLAAAGSFNRAELRLVRWFMEDPSARAIMLVNFHFGGKWRRRVDAELSSVLPGYLEGVEFEQDGKRQIRLIVEEGEAKGQHVLVRGSQLANLLVSLEPGQSAPMGIVNYKLLSRMPPYLACIRLASELRHIQNDGSDVFAILQVPKDPQQFVSFLEEKLRFDQAHREIEYDREIPLFIRVHALSSDSPIKAALNAWGDKSIPKSLLVSDGVAEPGEVVLDAFSIAYLAMTNAVEKLIGEGFTFVLPAETKVILEQWIADVTHEDFLMMGVNGAGRLVRTTASDVQARDGHTLQAMRRILETCVVRHPVVHDTSLELYSIKDGIDITVYLAMQLSSANDLPWFCMDVSFAGLHHSKGWKVADVNSILLRVVDTADFDFEEKRHGLLLFALGTLPRALTLTEMRGLAQNPNPLSSYILSMILQNHGKEIINNAVRHLQLLDLLITHLIATFYRADTPSTIAPGYTPWCRYDEHVFNHGMRLFASNRDGKPSEYWLAVALKVCLKIIRLDKALTLHVVDLFEAFVIGHFMDVGAIAEHYAELP